MPASDTNAINPWNRFRDHRQDLKRNYRMHVRGICLEIGAGPGLFTCLFAAHFPDVKLTVTEHYSN